MDIITYSLYDKNNKSNGYYNNIDKFTDKVVIKIKEDIHEDITNFKDYIVRNNIEELRTNIEYYIEVLMLGVLWKSYVNKSVQLNIVPKLTLTGLSKLRENRYLKKPTDFFRGVVGTAFLNNENNEDINISIKNLNYLIDWLLSTGDFKEEVKRLKNWSSYLSSINEKEATNIIQICVNIANWFEDKSEEALGKYTINVDKFLAESYKKHKWKEDYIYCGRKKIEYYLNMVGAEMMNRAYRKDFVATLEKRLLLPACMRVKSANQCKAFQTKEGFLCRNCTETCKINQFTRLGQKYNFSTYIIPHESSIVVKEKNNKDKIGIIGVACVLNLISGGWKAKNLGFIPQCVLLDYCGCKNHWHSKGIITDININRLLYTVGVN